MMSAKENAQAPESDATRQGARRWLSRAVAVVYGLVMFEVVIMVSPFAFYFYAAYGPTLKWLNHSAATAWLTGFLLPHAVFTTSPFLEFLRWDLGRYFFGLGLLAFFVLAAQIYGSKLFGQKLVSSGIYRYIRHPQYLSLGLSAFGLFTMWPRMIIFLLFVGMLFAYYFLARVEERRMLAIDHTYADYMRGTGMFLPGNPGGRLYRRLFGNLREQKFARRLALTSLLVLVLRRHSACVPTLCGISLAPPCYRTWKSSRFTQWQLRRCDKYSPWLCPIPLFNRPCSGRGTLLLSPMFCHTTMG